MKTFYCQLSMWNLIEKAEMGQIWAIFLHLFIVFESQFRWSLLTVLSSCRCRIYDDKWLFFKDP